jgi:integrase
VKHRLITRSKRRDRRPANEELQKLDEYFHVRDRHRCTVVPMRPILWFAVYSACRESEICRLEWADNDASAKLGLVRDAKHPREKLGNHLRFKYTPHGWDIVHAQPKYSRYVFPYNPKSVSDAFTSCGAQILNQSVRELSRRFTRAPDDFESQHTRCCEDQLTVFTGKAPSA